MAASESFGDTQPAAGSPPQSQSLVGVDSHGHDQPHGHGHDNSNDPPQARSAATRLPAELLLLILGRLERKPQLLSAALVCRAWAAAGLPLLWRRIECFTDDWDSFKSLFLKPRRLWLDYRTAIHSLSLTASSYPWLHGDLRLSNLRTLLSACRSLARLVVDTPSLNDDDAWILSTACPALTHVRLVSGLHSTGRISDEGLVALAQNCKALRGLGLKSMSADVVTERGVLAIVDGTRGRLESFGLELSGPRLPVGAGGGSGHGSGHGAGVVGGGGIGGGGGGGQPLAGPASMAGSTGGSGGLSSAGGSFADTTDSARRLGDALAALVTSNPGLSSLSLDWPVAMDTTLAAAAATLTRLTHLQLGNTRSVAVITTLIARNPLLASLRLVDIPLAASPASIASLLTPLLESAQPLPPRLTCLDLDGLGFLPDLVPITASFTRLTTLKLSPSRRMASVHSTSLDDLLVRVAQSLPLLQVLAVPILSDPVLVAFVQACPHLVDLDVMDGRFLSNLSIVVLAKSCGRLARLALGSAKDVGDAGVEAVARFCGQRLVRLVLPFGAGGITVRGLDAVTRDCSGLRGLANVPASVGVQALLDMLPRLDKLLVVSLCMASVPSATSPASASLAASGGAGLHAGGPAGARFFLSREDQDRIKRACKRLKHIVHNG
ncbi:hypothetical protein BC831DRAFT_396732 [Entophlyctis helioformis]|nr:hypothetical protein BC831DRAFT_396732 [Entophlyctis helioformis]